MLVAAGVVALVHPCENPNERPQVNSPPVRLPASQPASQPTGRPANHPACRLVSADSGRLHHQGMRQADGRDSADRYAAGPWKLQRLRRRIRSLKWRRRKSRRQSDGRTDGRAGGQPVGRPPLRQPPLGAQMDALCSRRPDEEGSLRAEGAARASRPTAEIKRFYFIIITIIILLSHVSI